MISTTWSQWQTVDDDRRCEPCEDRQGKIYTFHDLLWPYRPLHPFCCCYLTMMKKRAAGTLSSAGQDGADWWIINKGYLPPNYIDKQSAKLLGWKKKQVNFQEVCPDMLMGGDVYYNNDGHLPSAPGRVWYEADLEYGGGYRSSQRIVYSNDGLMFATLDHYQTWIEVINKKEK